MQLWRLVQGFGSFVLGMLCLRLNSNVRLQLPSPLAIKYRRLSWIPVEQLQSRASWPAVVCLMALLPGSADTSQRCR